MSIYKGSLYLWVAETSPSILLAKSGDPCYRGASFTVVPSLFCVHQICGWKSCWPQCLADL